jgi:hypothetical protein
MPAAEWRASTQPREAAMVGFRNEATVAGVEVCAIGVEAKGRMQAPDPECLAAKTASSSSYSSSSSSSSSSNIK